MRLFRVYVDGALFYHPHMSKLAITEAKVQEDAENIDSLTLSAPFSHPYLDSIKPMASTITCVKGDSVVFEGRALDDGSDFYNTHTWTCESCLAYLKDTVQPPFSYQGTLRGLLELFVTNHNNAVEEKKRFTLGNVTVTDGNDYINRSSSEYSVTLDAVREKLLDTHGGYLTVRYANGVRYLDWLTDFDAASVQTVEFGKNLLDVKISRDHTERATALIPLGTRITDEDGAETEERVTIASVNDGENYIFDETAVAEIGWIWRTEVWDDVTLPANLLRKARARLAELVSGVTSMELTIVDESDAGADIGDIHARQYDGTYARGLVNYAYSSCDGNNAVTRATYYKRSTATTWTNANRSFSSDTAFTFGGGNLSTEYTYDIQYRLTDAFTTITVTDTVSTASVVMDFLRGGRGVAVGKVAETQNCFEVSGDWSAKFNGTTYLGTSTLGGTAKPIYLNDGVPTALSATVGGANKPVYLSGGTVTVCSAPTVTQIHVSNISVAAATWAEVVKTDSLPAGTYLVFGNATVGATGKSWTVRVMHGSSSAEIPSASRGSVVSTPSTNRFTANAMGVVTTTAAGPFAVQVWAINATTIADANINVIRLFG